MHYRPDYPIVERKLSRVRVRRRSRRPGHGGPGGRPGTGHGHRQRNSARPLQQRNGALGLAALCLVVALLYLALGAPALLHAPSGQPAGKVSALKQPSNAN